MAAKVFFITGKGGVGKSTLANAMASAFGSQGHKTLLLEVSSFSALTPESREEFGALFAKQKLQLHEVVEEYFRIQLQKFNPTSGTIKKFSNKLGAEVSKHLLANRFVLKFVEACPGLAPTIFLGKICWEAREGKDAEGRPWDYIVVDAPATGQSLQLFESTQILSRVLNTGMVFRHIRETLDFARSPNFHIEIVALAEPGPLQECREMITRLQSAEFVPSRVWVNRIISASDIQKFKSEVSSAGAETDPALSEVLEDERDRADYETKEITNLKAELQCPLKTIEEFKEENFEEVIQKISETCAEEFLK